MVAFAALASRFFVAALFTVAGLVKLPQRREFELAVRNYQLTPPGWSRAIALALPPLELACGLLLAIGLAIRVVSSLIAAMLCAFALAAAVNLARGRQIDCGCFSQAVSRRVTWLTVLRNLLLAAMASFVAFAYPTGLSLDAVLLGSAPSIAPGEAAIVAAAAVSLLVAAALAGEAFRLLTLRRRLGALIGAGT